LSVIGHDL